MWSRHAHQGVTRDRLGAHLKAQNPQAVESRQPGKRNVHRAGLWSNGSNEEWGIDGHEKLTHSMGISIVGITDKFSRMELMLVAMPNARVQEAVVAVYLRTVKKWGGEYLYPIQTWYYGCQLLILCMSAFQECHSL